MKRCRALLLVVCFFLPVAGPFAQTPPAANRSAGNPIIYLSPKDGDRYVPMKTTLIVRFAREISADALSQNYSFHVRGTRSGLHSGKIVLSDDNRTLIFKPDNSFLQGEGVSVELSKSDADRSPLVQYGFQITEMPEPMRDQILSEVRLDEVKDRQPDPIEHSKDRDEVLHNLHNNDSLPCYYHIDTLGNPTLGNVFFSAVNLFGGAFSFIGIINNSGSPSFYRNIPRGCENFKSLPDHTFSYFSQTSVPQSGVSLGYGLINRIDSNGNLLEIYQCGNGYTTDYHDFELLPNDHALLLSFDPEYVDMTKIISDTGAKTHAKVIGAIIQEIDKDKNVVFQWRSWDHCQITDATFENFRSSTVDYVHINTAFIDTDGNIIASFRHMDEIMKISHNDASTIWRWGGKNNQFIFSGDTLQFSHQHNPTRISNGHITIWDNGNYHFIDTIIKGRDTIVNKPFSRAIEFELNERDHIAKKVWEYRKVPLSLAGGNVQRLENGNTFMGFGLQTTPNMMEITPAGEKVFQMSLDYGAWCYRAYRFPELVTASAKISESKTFAISSIYPNPAGNISTVEYTAGDGYVIMTLMDLLGNIKRTSSQLVSSGENSFHLNLSDLPEGTYYCRISQNGKSDVRMIVVRK